ncbi:MAG: GIY-YIG nuclease family protein [Bacteroidales bacterium]|jgi:putative endonuclease|nr:GIY-YIG nuclease family protein [Bacteroidales bacterium]
MTWNSNYFVYIITNWNNSVTYIGVTNNLKRRIYEHKNRDIDGFTKKYNVNKLVYYEHFSNIEFAIIREKQMKKWKRQWKNELVEKENPNWDNLYEII